MIHPSGSATGAGPDGVRDAVLDLLDLLAERGDRLRLDDEGRLDLVADTITDRLTGRSGGSAGSGLQVVAVLDDLRGALGDTASREAVPGP